MSFAACENFQMTRMSCEYTKIDCIIKILTVPLETKTLFEEPSFSKTVTIPGLRTASVGTCFGRIPKEPLNDGTSTCFTLALA